MKIIKDEQFQSMVLESKKPVVVDFFAEWCGPCRQMSSILEEVAPELEDKIDIVKMNVDDAPNTPSQYDIRNIPALLVFKNGEEVDRQIGAVPKEDFVAWLKNHF